MRIVGGEFKGRRLIGPEGDAARPTSDKVREALFSILGDVAGLHVLDLFAGTGALGLEALSRGAAHAVLVERDRRMSGVLGRNVEAMLGAQTERTKLVRFDALKYLADGRGREFELVLLDPPYAHAPRLAGRLTELLPGVLAEQARVAVESDRRSPLDLGSEAFTLASEHRYGDTLLRIFNAL